MTLFVDLDGPLLDVSERYFRVHVDILSRFGLKSIDKPNFWNGKRNRRPLSLLLTDSGATFDEGAYSKLWLENIESDDYLSFDRVHDGVIPLLQHLGQEHTQVLVTLRQRSEAVRAQLSRLQLNSYFRAILTAAPLSHHSWRVKRNLIESSGLADETSWIVGDTEVDILAGKSLGLTTVAVLSGIRNEELLKQMTPDFILPGILELPKVLPSGKSLVYSGRTEEFKPQKDEQ
jgi:phosphoglycolate phosphatase